ncbi:glycosyltransferase family 4 protein [Novosphingobium mangrovi (ex Hu et al. 2023)]|uniref:Glycosyltransferase family 4 protein n=1 Tax=Novosphingobium mangrovi (ex Hu et al. 2023) TaxID=2930094 RepID=A0ABT0AI40_9SPHN|nr:glycosyltransferase family 1 protein [Novosphingobium mangrovi (ex Hu et al. 2023)]MCJ1962869.1 glycosyltransferase family 4 protein [Novosphingobium mangrovi (ex Hu et al. 2023)]
MHGPVAVGGHAPGGGQDEQAAGELVINGRFLCQPATGVQRVAREFVLALERLLVRGEFPGLRARLVAPSEAEFGALNLACIAPQHLPGGTGHYWEQVTLPRHVGDAHLLCLGNLAPLRSLIGGAPVAVMLHDQSFRTFKGDYSLPYRLFHEVVGHFLVRRARPLITVSQIEAEAIRAANGGRPEQLVVAPNGSWMNDEPAPPRPARDTAAAPYVLHVGGFSERKNVGRVFAAAEVLAGDGVEVRLVGRPNARCEEWLAGLSPEVRARVRFTGFVDNAQLTRLYSEAACLMYPSLYEASGLPPSEAMRLGCPVVVSDLPVLRERCGEAALYCDPLDAASLVARVREVLGDPFLAGRLSQRGQARSQIFSWENQARIIVRALGFAS